MSGIYIPGMEMPKDEYVGIFVYPDGRVHVWRSMSLVGQEYKAIPVPDHGRLIDADALLTSKGVGTQIAGWGKMYHETCIEYAPTIIPAEEGQ